MILLELNIYFSLCTRRGSSTVLGDTVDVAVTEGDVCLLRLPRVLVGEGRRVSSTSTLSLPAAVASESTDEDAVLPVDDDNTRFSRSDATPACRHGVQQTQTLFQPADDRYRTAVLQHQL